MKNAAQIPIKLSQLQILVAVADQQNFSEAALALGISQSAVSHAVATLEERLGVVIFSRGRYGARLTPVGDRILGHARVVVERTEAIAKEAALAKGLETGQVRLASFRSIAAQLLPPILARFHQRFPGLTLKLTEHDSHTEVEQALREGRVDIGITLLPAGSLLSAWELLRDEFVVLLPPGVAVRGDRLSWEQLTEQPLIMPPVDDPMMRPLYDHINGLGYWLRVVNQVATDATTVRLVAEGVGGTILPRLAAEPIPESVQRFSLPVPLERQVGVAVLAAALQTPAVYALLEMIRRADQGKLTG